MTTNKLPVDMIVTSDSKFVEVTASPGSGKTHTLIKRIHHLLSEGVSPQKILVLSFSNASVGVIRRRLDSCIDSEAEPQFDHSLLKKVTAKTTHSFASSLQKNKIVLKDKEAITYLTQAINKAITECQNHKLWSSQKSKIRSSRIQQLQNLLQKPQSKTVLDFLSVVAASRKTIKETLAMSRFSSFKKHVAVLSAVSRRFTAIKHNKGVIDFGDILKLAIKAIQDNPKLVTFTHVLVDEYQDCSAAQTHLLAELALLFKSDLKVQRSIMVLGDSNQAIFGFSGANYTPLSSAVEGVQTLSLPLSWRLTKQTAALASAITGDPKIETDKDGEKPVLVLDQSLEQQTQHIVSDIKALIDSGIEPQKIVVLARTKALLHPVEQLLLAKSIPSERSGLARNKKHVLRVLKLLRLSEIGNVNQEALIKKMSPFITIPEPEPDSGIKANDRWKSALSMLKKVSKYPSMEGRFIACLKIYLHLMGGIEKDKVLQADVNRWAPFSRGFETAKSMMTAVKAMYNNSEVSTGTIHSAKGGEWDHVFIVGVTTGLLPLYLAYDDYALTEERNLLYVAITRASLTVRLYHAPTAHSGSRQSFKDLSRFLDTPEVRETLTIKN